MESPGNHDLLTFDRAHIWHPYTSMKDPLPVYPVAAAVGVHLILEDGRRLIDGMSSWWAAIHGYNHPVLNAAAHAQLEKVSHVMFGGLTHAPAVALATFLLDLAPEPLEQVFFADSGSVSVEVAIKMVLQYWQAKDRPEKHRLLTVRSGYHGDTLGAMAVCDPEKGMHGIFSGNLVKHYFADTPMCGYDDPWDETDIQSLKTVLEKHHRDIAAIIMEPVVQGAGGMRFYSPHYLRRVWELSREFDVRLILDEIATGFGRTGTLFACEKAGISPDIMCVGKALTGGYMTLAATLTTRDISDGISNAEPGVFMHGPTFMANPLACAVANASLELLMNSPWQARVKRIERQLKAELTALDKLPWVADVRVLGAIGVVELNHAVDLARMQKRFVERGVWIRPFGKLVYTMPPYIIDPSGLTRITRAMVEVIELEDPEKR
jgi:adenosylmethionine---8-amino-7-oxononanoate aminotransferase